MPESYDMAELQRQYAQDGVIFVPGLMDGDALDDARAAFDWSFAHPGPSYSEFPGDAASKQDLANPAAYDAYRPMLSRSPLGSFLARLWGSRAIWFMYEQVFHKQPGGGPTTWHQDTPFLPVDGKHLGVAWVSFDQVLADEALEFSLGSHLGPLYNAFDPTDLSAPLYKTGNMPLAPDIEAERHLRRIGGWACEPGDVIIFHPSLFHGGGTPRPDRHRRTLAMRFFGDDAIYARRPGETPAPCVEGLHETLQSGDPFRHPVFPRLK